MFSQRKWKTTLIRWRIHFLYYNFVRIHNRTAPAMAAGVTDRLWEVADMVNVLEVWEAAIEHLDLPGKS
jgi:hypothetical protein